MPGIGLAIVIAVIEFLWNGWRPHYAVLGRVNSIRGYHDLKRYPDARLIPGLVLFRWDAPLFFANAGLYHQCVLEAVARSPTPVRGIIVAAEPVTSIDVSVRFVADAGLWIGPCNWRPTPRSSGPRHSGPSPAASRLLIANVRLRPQLRAVHAVVCSHDERLS
jgi:MFS superfamily sulfate permease-like transporter